MVVGAPVSDGSTGAVKIYEYDAASSDWVQRGNTILGRTGFDLAGTRVKLSSDGSTVAITSPMHTGGGASDTGLTQVFTYNQGSSTWLQLGNDMIGDVGDRAGNSLSLAEDGRTVAFGASRGDKAYVYRYNPSLGEWRQLGLTLEGESSGVDFGYSVALDGTGEKLAVGAWRTSIDAGRNNGIVDIFSWDGTQWVLDQQLPGGTLEGFGYSLAFSPDNTLLSAGSKFSRGSVGPGHVRVFELNTADDNWSQLGENILGPYAQGEFGTSVDITRINGTPVFVAGGPIADSDGREDDGVSSVYAYDGNEWYQLGQDVLGEASFARAGSSVSISGDTVAIGASYFEEASGSNPGYVNTFQVSP